MSVQALAPAPSPSASAAQLDEQLALLTAQAQRLCALLELRIARGRFRELEAYRCLAIVSQVTGRLAAIVAHRAAVTGPEELDRFWGAVADRVRELGVAGDESDPYNPALIEDEEVQSPTEPSVLVLPGDCFVGDKAAS